MSKRWTYQNVERWTLETERLRIALRSTGDRKNDREDVRAREPFVLLHGNVSSSRFFEEIMTRVPDRMWGVAPDLRGFGYSQRKPVDATRGLGDFVDDLHGLRERLGWQRPMHLLGWSMGGGVAMQYALTHPEAVASLTLVAPVSPYGFGGTHGVNGTPNFDDFAGSGGGTANPDFVQRLARGDAESHEDTSPRNILNRFYFRPPFEVGKHRENDYVASMLRTTTGDENYPGDSVASDNWPGMAPGTRGVLNAIAPRHFNTSGLADLAHKPPILWIRGDSDQIVSDASLFDLGTLGQLGAVPGWPGADRVPPQPMIAQTRAVLERYSENGGTFVEEVIEESGHSPFIEKPEAFIEAFSSFLRRHG